MLEVGKWSEAHLAVALADWGQRGLARRGATNGKRLCVRQLEGGIGTTRDRRFPVAWLGSVDGVDTRVNEQSLLKIAFEFRDAAATLAPFDQKFAALGNFPNGCCKDASFLLARVMELRHSIRDTAYVEGRRGVDSLDWHSHGWLEVAGYIVDVTADQFHDGKAVPLVLPADASVFHATFEISAADPYPRFWNGFHSEAAGDFEASCQAILDELDL